MAVGVAAFGLNERLEQSRLIFQGDADAGVLHRKPHPILPVGSPYQLRFDLDMAFGREFDGVTEEIVKDLAQPRRIEQ